MDQALVPIYTAENLAEAQLLRNWLAERGISAWIINEALSGGVGGLPAGWTSSPRVVVSSDDAPKARDIALAFDQGLAVSRQGAPDAPHDPAAYDQGPLLAWPYCPVCSERRLAVCPYCGTASTSFPQGFDFTPRDADALDDSPPMVVCSMCDEPFRPEFYKHCEHCGYEFEDGVVVDEPLSDEDLTRSRVREWQVMGMLIALLILGLLYLGYVLG